MSIYIGNESQMAVLYRATGLYYVTDHILLCAHHARGMSLQPFSDYDREQGFGKYGCPFCPGGLLEHTFYLHRSQAKILKAIHKLEQVTQTGFETYRRDVPYGYPKSYLGG